MKNIFTLGLLVCITIAANAQATNQWINFDKTYYKIKVAQDGIYRIDYTILTEQGFSVDFSNSKNLNLIHQGEEVPLFISDVENWGEGEYIEFYGKKLDGKFDQRLFENVEDQLHPYWSQFTDTAVYFLNYAESTQKITEIENDLSNLPEKESYFNYTTVFYMITFHSSGTPDARIVNSPIYEERRGINSYFARYSEGEGWLGNLYAANNLIASNSSSILVNTPSIFYDGGTANITFKISGVSSDTTVINNHHTQVHINGQLFVDDRFDGYSTKKHTIEVPLNQLSNPRTEFEFTALSQEEVNDKQAVSHITVNYPRRFDFEEVDHLAFSMESKPSGNYLEFENLKVGHDFYLYDITNLIKIKLQYDWDRRVHKVYLPFEGSAKLELVLQNEGEIKEVNEMEPTTFIDYSDKINQGDYIIISHPNLMSEGSAVNSYVNYRSSNEGGGYKPVLVDVENLYDQYSYGIRKHPLSIKYFLNDAIENWDIAPTNCFLLGKAIKNSKCRTSRSIGNSPLSNWHKNLVPSFGDAPNDQYFGAKDFNPLSRIAIGRLSIDNAQDIQHYLDKVLTVEQKNNIDDCSYIDEAQWRHQMFHIGGGNEIEQATHFAERLTHQAGIAQNGVLTANTSYLYRSKEVGINSACIISDDIGFPIVEATEECLNRVFDEGKRIVNFLGHASGLLWEIKIGEPEDHTYNQKYPILISQCNFNGDVYKSFADEGTFSMPEAWLKANEAGATAFVGFDFVYDMLYAADLIDDLYDEMFNLKPNATLGEQINAVIHQHYNDDDIVKKHTVNHLVFAGDPALKYYIQTKPEISITENDVSVTVNQINDFYYSVEIVFDFKSLNIASVDFIPYNIILMAGDTETEVSNKLVKINEQGFFKDEFTLLPNQAHTFRIQLDNDNEFNEICEDNNSFEFIVGEWVIGIEDNFLDKNQITIRPNPFNTQTTFTINLDQAVLWQKTYLIISNINGKKVQQIQLQKGLAQQQVGWNGSDIKGNKLPAGVYSYQLKNISGQALSLPNKVVLMK